MRRSTIGLLDKMKQQIEGFEKIFLNWEEKKKKN